MALIFSVCTNLIWTMTKILPNQKKKTQALGFPYGEKAITGIEKPLRDHNFQSLLTEIFGEIDTSIKILEQLLRHTQYKHLMFFVWA